ncbi:uncharacterized protein [Apostichopus japonicus]|uniref:uncharacterized protein n=1 Tax=Stichopus japonicus TaxID=307972 RepID=UPI003AB36B11
MGEAGDGLRWEGERGGVEKEGWERGGSCSNPAVGLEEGVISLDQISMSSYLGGNEDGPLGISKDHVRLNSDGGWCAKEQDDIDDINEWIQINFNEIKDIGGFASQGFNHPDIDPIYCSQFTVSYRESSDSAWTVYQEGGNDKIFDGNYDKNTAVVNMFAVPFRAIQIRIHPTACYNHPCVRLEIYGCPVDCEPNPCKQNVSCSDDFTDLWNVTCDCPPGYVGDFCQVNFDECASDPCQNGATCIDHVDYYTCDCASGWEAYDCQTETDECLSNPCQNGATCTDLLDGYNCTCINGFEGTHCENFTVECSDGFVEGIHTCYQVVHESVNATNASLAREACDNVRGHLFYPSVYWEQDHLSKELKALNIPSSKTFFIGLRWDGSNVAFDNFEADPDLTTWYDESNNAVDPWAGGYPTGSAGCVAMVMDGSDWKWRNIDCDSQLGYICQQDRTNGNFSQWSPWGSCSVTCGPGEGIQVRTRTCTDPAPLLAGEECEGTFNETQVCGEICPIVDCPEGYVTRYDTCYLLRTNDTASYADAKADCENLTEVYGGHLIFMNDRSEEAFVSQMLFDYKVNLSLAYFTSNLYRSSIYFDWIFANGEANVTSWESFSESPWGTTSGMVNLGGGGGASAGATTPAMTTVDDSLLPIRCVVLRREGTLWKWFLESCDQTTGYICEVNLGG